MDLGNMRENGTRYVTLWCTIDCGHHIDILVDDLPAESQVRAIGANYRCSRCGRRAPESRPAWHRPDDPPA